MGLSRLAGSIIERCNPVIKEADVEKIGDFIKNLCKVPDNLVLVLDDLERTSISMELILGYVSNMMDDVGIKVILLCDQDHIPNTDDSFLCFKEKVVGSTVAVIPDIEAVFECQLAEIKNEKLKIYFITIKI